MSDPMALHVYLHLDSGVVTQKLDQILTQLAALSAQEIRMDAKTQAALDNLNAQVAAETDVETAVETLLTGLSAQIAALKVGQTDPAVIAAIDNASAIVANNVAKTKAAVVANTQTP